MYSQLVAAMHPQPQGKVQPELVVQVLELPQLLPSLRMSKAEESGFLRQFNKILRYARNDIKECHAFPTASREDPTKSTLTLQLDHATVGAQHPEGGFWELKSGELRRVHGSDCKCAFRLSKQCGFRSRYFRYRLSDETCVSPSARTIDDQGVNPVIYKSQLIIAADFLIMGVHEISF